MAVGALASREKGLRQVVLVALRFGLGHMGLLLVLGSLALFKNVAIRPEWETSAEALGGAVLVVMGARIFQGWLKEIGYVHNHPHVHRWLWPRRHTHAHFHFKGRRGGRHIHPHTSTMLGGLFALSGLRSLLLGVVPVLETRSLPAALGTILLFGLGILFSMVAVGVLSGSTLLGGRRRPWISLLLALMSVGLGSYWVWTCWA